MVRIVVVDDTRLYREGLALLLSQGGEIRVVGTAAHKDEALRSVRELQPDLALIRMSMADSVATLRAVAEVAPGVRVVAIGITETEHDVIACAEAGIAGYVLRDASVDELVATLRSVARGETLCSPKVAATLLKRLASLAAERQTWRTHPHLTRREREILGYVDVGLSNKEIAHRLSIEVRTVKNHVHNVLEKLQVHRRGEAAALVRGAPNAFVHPRP
jgi:DNA-binding NarL/FixJ family response regulator